MIQCDVNKQLKHRALDGVSEARRLLATVIHEGASVHELKLLEQRALVAEALAKEMLK